MCRICGKNKKNTFLKKAFALFLLWSIVGTATFAQSPTQTIRGTIVDADTQLPLIGATVLLLGSDPLIGAATDTLGRFRINDVEVGYHKLQIDFLGYAKLLLPELLLESGNEQVLELQLEKEEYGIEELVLYAPAYSPASDALVSKEVITVEEARRFPATFDDPARLAMSYPGVVSVNDQANHISIRGNSPAAMTWNLEGVEIVNPSHTSNAGTANDRPSANGGGVNILSAQLLGASTFLSGAFPANFGNSLSGVMDMQLRKGNSEQYEFTGQIGLIGIDLAAEGPLGKKRDASFLINYRYSTLGILSAMGVDLGGEAIAFQDLSFNLKLPTAKAGKFTLFGIGGQSSNVFNGPRDTSQWEIQKDQFDIDFRSQMGVLGMTHILPLGAGVWRTSVAYSALETTRNANQLDENFVESTFGRDTLGESKLSIHSSWANRLNDKIRWQVGTTMTLYDFQVFSESPLNTRQIGTGGGWLLQPYGNLRLALLPAVEFMVGVHYAYFSFNQKSSIEPRAALRWQRGKHQWSMAYGLHSKLQQAQVYFLQTPGLPSANRNLDFTKAHHLVLAHQIMTGPSTRLKTELYYQRLFNVPIANLPLGVYSTLNLFEAFDLPAADFENTGKGKNYGIEISWQHFINKGYYYLLNGSLFNAKYTDGNVERNTRFNSQYLFNLTGGKEFTKEKKGSQRTWGLNLRISYLGGFWETPIDEERSSTLGYTVFDESLAFSQKLPDVFKIDTRFYFRKNRQRSSTTVALDLQNMTNAQNLASRYYDAFQGKVLNRYQLGLIPNLSWRIEF